MRHMSPAIVEKITDDILHSPLRHTVCHVECSENGDAFLNPEAVNCLRIVKRKLPACTVSIFTNFQTLNAALADEILRAKLIDRFVCNIDGHDEEHYRAVKGVGLKRAESNLRHFLDLRRQLGEKASLHINVVQYNDYVDTIQKHLGVVPNKASGRVSRKLTRDFDLVWKKWKPLVDSQKDSIQRVKGFFGWAERSQCAGKPIAYENFSCPVLDGVRHSAFIAPDGTWYACCLDAECELVIGNVMNEPLHELMMSERRSSLISQLENREFARIGGPCRTVSCCQTMTLNEPMERLADLIRRSPLGESLKRLSANSPFWRHWMDRIRG